MEKKEPNIRYSLSEPGEERKVYGNYNIYAEEIAFDAPPKEDAPPVPHQQKKADRQVMLNCLQILYREKNKQFKKAKVKRTIITIIGLAIFYFLPMLFICDYTGTTYYMDQFGNISVKNTFVRIEVIANMVIAAIVLAGLHFLVNFLIFRFLVKRGIEENKELKDIKQSIDDLSH